MAHLNVKRGMKAACAAAALTSCWAGPAVNEAHAGVAVGYPAAVKTNLSTALDNAYLIYGINTSGVDFEAYTYPIGSIGTGPVTVNVNLEYPFNPDTTNFQWTLLGTYGEDDSVSVSMWPSVAEFHVTNGNEWPEVFDATYSEADIYAALVSDNTGTLIDFFEIHPFSIAVGFDQIATQVNFSEASDNGSSILTFIPEPASASLLALGAWVLSARRRE